jgi:hypothetical protein
MTNTFVPDVHTGNPSAKYLYEFRCLSPKDVVTFVYVIGGSPEHATERLHKEYKAEGCVHLRTGKVSKLNGDWR